MTIDQPIGFVGANGQTVFFFVSFLLFCSPDWYTDAALYAVVVATTLDV